MTVDTDAGLAIETEGRFGAHNYEPLPVVLCRGEGVWVHDVVGRRYFDALSAYSALNFGHRHPRLLRAASEQLGRLTLKSRAFHNDQLGRFCAELAEFCGSDRVLPMNTGAEAVETAIKLARKWGYERKRVGADRAQIVVCAGNFHGRTTTIVGFSDDPLARTGFGQFGPGFVTVPYGDPDALRAYNHAGTGTYFLDKAHSTYLQMIMELGWPAAAALYAGLGLLVFRCLQGRSAVYPAVLAACSVLVAVHALVDFSLEMPAVAATYALLLGVGCAQAVQGRPGRGPT